jgi:hypothetical protein
LRAFEEKSVVFDGNEFPSLLSEASDSLFPGIGLERKCLDAGGLIKTKKTIATFRRTADKLTIFPGRHVTGPFFVEIGEPYFLLEETKEATYINTYKKKDSHQQWLSDIFHSLTMKCNLKRHIFLC